MPAPSPFLIPGNFFAQTEGLAANPSLFTNVGPYLIMSTGGGVQPDIRDSFNGLSLTTAGTTHTYQWFSAPCTQVKVEISGTIRRENPAPSDFAYSIEYGCFVRIAPGSGGGLCDAWVITSPLSTATPIGSLLKDCQLSHFAKADIWIKNAGVVRPHLVIRTPELIDVGEEI